MSAIFLSALAIFSNYKQNIEGRKADNARYFLEQYKKVIIEEKKALKTRSISNGEYFSSYWDLQYNQWVCWKKGLLDEEYFSDWMDLRYEEYTDNELTNGMSYRSGWDLAKRHIANKEFKEFMEMVFQGNEEIYKNRWLGLAFLLT